MLSPRKVKFWAAKKEKENYAFRTYLKFHADADRLDEQFKELHEELFANYDCSRCRNCCKLFYGNIPQEDISSDAAHLSMSEEEFTGRYMKPEVNSEGLYRTKHKPCDFLEPDGECILGECKPECCKKYPHTDQPDRMASLLSVLDNVEICPVVYEIWERLKEIYEFDYRKQKTGM